jgi:DNA-binding GntR family transcriptional regulator
MAGRRGNAPAVLVTELPAAILDGRLRPGERIRRRQSRRVWCDGRKAIAGSGSTSWLSQRPARGAFSTAGGGRLWNLSAPYRLAYVRNASPEEMAAVRMEHRLLLDVIERGWAAEAELLLITHIRRTQSTLRATPRLFDDH